MWQALSEQGFEPFVMGELSQAPEGGLPAMPIKLGSSFRFRYQPAGH